MAIRLNLSNGCFESDASEIRENKGSSISKPTGASHHENLLTLDLTLTR